MFNGRSTELNGDIITHDGFWPDVAIAEFQQQRAIPLQIPQEMIKSALVAAMQSVSLELVNVEARYKAAGILQAADISGSRINGENEAQILFKKAVHARAKAELLPEFNTLSGREIHQNRDFVIEQKSLQTEATLAIRALKGKKRGTVWLL